MLGVGAPDGLTDPTLLLRNLPVTCRDTPSLSIVPNHNIGQKEDLKNDGGKVPHPYTVVVGNST